ncbi:hypothetical protein [Halobacillus karajensis]|uniref:hypothetical protein n=1 Tax=Halobacillus karajensis TaxID=195088 RepID=UPI0012DFA854|nr:hypothetical protein [Halobacillus karajensis]
MQHRIQQDNIVLYGYRVYIDVYYFSDHVQLLVTRGLIHLIEPDSEEAYHRVP